MSAYDKYILTDEYGKVVMANATRQQIADYFGIKPDSVRSAYSQGYKIKKHNIELMTFDVPKAAAGDQTFEWRVQFCRDWIKTVSRLRK